jgi:ankyrin repeat protein
MLSARDHDGQTAFDWAERTPEFGKLVVQYLLDRGLSRETPGSAARTQPPPSPTASAPSTRCSRRFLRRDWRPAR